jgi:hypothetical protein
MMCIYINKSDGFADSKPSQNTGDWNKKDKFSNGLTCCASNSETKKPNHLKPVPLRFLSLNVCGLLAKQKFPDLDEIISKMDIVCLTETKLDDFDKPEFNEHICFTKNRRRYINKSGGIALLVRNNFINNIKIIVGKEESTKIEATMRKHYKITNYSVPENVLFF